MTLSNAELEIMRADIEALLPDTCSIISVTLTSNGAGGFTESFGTASASCRKDTKTVLAVDSGGVVNTTYAEMITLPWDTTIANTSRIVHGGNTYKVIGVTDGSWLCIKRVEVRKI
jgi:hypothetical protein